MLVGQGWVARLRPGADPPRLRPARRCPATRSAPRSPTRRSWCSPCPNPVDYMPTQFAAALARSSSPSEVKKAGLVYADYPATKDPKDKVVGDLHRRTASSSCRLRPDLRHPGRGRLEAARPEAEGLRRRGRLLRRLAVPELRELARCRQPGRLRPDLVQRHQHVRRDVRRLERERLRRQRLHAHRRSRRSFEADEVPAVAAVHRHRRRPTAARPNQLGAQAASAFLLWATAAKACGSDLTRECVHGRAGQGHELDRWRAALARATRPRTCPPTCGMVLKLTGTEFERVYPEEPGTLDCSPDYVQPVTGPLIERSNLDANRQSQLQ